MSLREVFSENLTRLCRGEQSIALVCRSTKINRQQFNRYLSGESIPSSRNFDKICRYFGVDEQQLFRQTADVGLKSSKGDEASWSAAYLRAALKLIHSDARPSIANGLYYADFAVPNDRKSIVRSTVVIRNDGNLTTFRRLTGLAERNGSFWSQFHGDHQGFILERSHVLYFVGLNERGSREPSLITLRWQSGSRPMLSGQALVMGPAGPSTTAVVLNPCKPGTKLISAIRASHVYSTDDPRIEQLILDALDDQSKGIANKVRRLDLSVRSLRPRKIAGRR